jgi:deoxyribonuclease IV
MARHLHFGPARVPSRDSPAAALGALLERGLTACEIDFEGRFWMDYDFAAEFGDLCAASDVALSVHAPIAGFMGHAERGKKLNMAIGMLDHSAGIAKAAGAELVVFHPGFLLGRTREDAIDAVVVQLGELRERLEAKDRAVPFGIEVMGRVRELGSIDDVCAIASRLDWVRPVIDFAHMHATSDGAFLTVEPFAAALEQADAVIEPGAPFHIHFSDIQLANLPNASVSGTLRPCQPSAPPNFHSMDTCGSAGSETAAVTRSSRRTFSTKPSRASRPSTGSSWARSYKS